MFLVLLKSFYHKARHKTLEDYIKLYRFYSECDAFESWIIDKVGT